MKKRQKPLIGFGGVAVVVLATYLQNEIKYPEHKRTTQTAVPKVFDV